VSREFRKRRYGDDGVGYFDWIVVMAVPLFASDQQGAVAAAGGFELACPMFCTTEIVLVRHDS
jgi:hypothetical protein